jgi:hypothetical protein
MRAACVSRMQDRRRWTETDDGRIQPKQAEEMEKAISQIGLMTDSRMPADDLFAGDQKVDLYYLKLGDVGTVRATRPRTE